MIIILIILMISISLSVPINADNITITGTLIPIRQNEYEITITFPQTYSIYYIEELNFTITENSPTNILTTIVNIKIFNLTILADYTVVYKVTLIIQKEQSSNIVSTLLDNIIGLIPVFFLIIVLLIKFPKIN